MGPDKAQGLRAYSALSDDPNSVSITHIRQSTTSCDSSSWGSNTLFGSYGHYHWNAHTCTQTYINLKIYRNSLQYLACLVPLPCWRLKHKSNWTILSTCVCAPMHVHGEVCMCVLVHMYMYVYAYICVCMSIYKPENNLCCHSSGAVHYCEVCLFVCLFVWNWVSAR